MAAGRTPTRRSRRTDYLVIGSGIAGLRAAIELAPAGRVLVVSKAALTESATQYAQGGIAAALSDEDEISLHYQDTLNAGDGLCSVEAVKVLCEEGPHAIEELIDWGTRFDREGSKLAFAREGAHSRSRVLHAQGDSTGREILRALFARARSLGGIEFLSDIFTIDLLLDDGRVSGVRYLDEKIGSIHTLEASAVLLATGGLGQVYAETTNPQVATGDGVAIAYRAGAVLGDLEFVQFHPTVLYAKGAPPFLLTEALRGEGAKLLNTSLERFMSHYHEGAELAPRDVVSRAIHTEMQRTGSDFVYLDLTALDPEFVQRRFPRVYQVCLEYNLDITSDLVPVRPAVHYAMGGVVTDLWGRTNVPGLYAAGEVASTDVHGANRLASNSLLEGLVFGARTGRTMREALARRRRSRSAATREQAVGTATQPALGATRSNPGASPAGMAPGETEKVLREAQLTMWKRVGIVRTAKELREALEHLGRIQSVPVAISSRRAYELANLLEVARFITACALAREESRGSHYRKDFPMRDDTRWARHSR
ncbi:MAG: L-aspartate oxidase, partial [Terriglobia bacterium]